MTTKNKQYLITVIIVLFLLVFYLDARSKAREVIVANTDGATTGFNGLVLAKELNDSFSQGWFGNTTAKGAILQKLNALSSGDLKVVYNTFARKYSKNFGNKTMKQVIADEWITWLTTNYQSIVVAKLDALGLP